MSLSPPLRRLSSTRSSSKESLINAYEAEEERIINVLSRKLEQLREEKIDLENTLEAESEAHVNRLSREISALRRAQQQQQQQQAAGATNGTATNGSGNVSPVQYRNAILSTTEPTTTMMLEAMRRENEQLRSRLVDTERDYIRISRLNEIYREELIEHRRRLGLPVDNLIGLASSSVDPYSQPLHRRQSISSSTSTSPYLGPSYSASTSSRVPIPRPASQIRRPQLHTNAVSMNTTPPSSASASIPSPFPFSPPASGTHPSGATSLTTPPSSGSLNAMAATAALMNPLELTYPSVPPPSLSSSFGEPALAPGSDIPSGAGSPIVNRSGGTASSTAGTGTAPIPLPRPIHRRDRDFSVSPVDTFGGGNISPSTGSRVGPSLSPRRSFNIPRRSSFDRSGRHSMVLSESPSGNAWITDALGNAGNSRERRGSFGRSQTRVASASVERGARIAETGTLVPRSSRTESVVDAPTGTNVNGTAGSEGHNASNGTNG
ncbi:hypothetical protein C8Q75DRAFT_762277 [Abortiporus biennis]|nr:hypothetical protein C8Q75DRAFT_762277 [Abortiporus biennis]